MMYLQAQLGNPIINIGIFAAFVVITMWVVIRVSQGGRKKAGDFYTGGAQFDGRPIGPLRAAPTHGQDTDTVLRELGLTEEQITGLRQRGVLA